MTLALWLLAAAIYALLVIAICRLMRKLPRDQDWILPTQRSIERRDSSRSKP